MDELYIYILLAYYASSNVKELGVWVGNLLKELGVWIGNFMEGIRCVNVFTGFALETTEEISRVAC